MHLIPRLSGCGVWGYGRVEVRLRREQRAVDQQRCWRTAYRAVRRFTTEERLVTKPTSHTAQLQDMCRGNARCELCPVTARLRPASLLLGRGGHRSRTGTP